jgi:O-antigen/teichoic acid export membrane protein
MESDLPPVEPKSFFRGKGALLTVLTVVLVLLIALPAYRWFFIISLGIGIVVAAILYFWNQHKPVKESSVEHKRPLGLE